MTNKTTEYGIFGQTAPELNVNFWIDKNGEKTSAIELLDFKGKFKVIYCFQAWCPGCHSQGLPSLKKMVDALEGNDSVQFLAIQTVFEGHHKNTFEKIIEIQKKYDIKIPFGHDDKSEFTNGTSDTMYHYRSGGTPWFIFIDKNDVVVFNDYHLDDEKAIEYLKTL